MSSSARILLSWSQSSFPRWWKASQWLHSITKHKGLLLEHQLGLLQFTMFELQPSGRFWKGMSRTSAAWSLTRKETCLPRIQLWIWPWGYGKWAMQASSQLSWVELAKAQERSSYSHLRQLSLPIGIGLALVARDASSQTEEARLRDFRIVEVAWVTQRAKVKAKVTQATAAKSGSRTQTRRSS